MAMCCQRDAAFVLLHALLLHKKSQFHLKDSPPHTPIVHLQQRQWGT